MSRYNTFIYLLWIGAIVAVLVMAALGPAGWDFDVYWRAAQAVRQGIDPYSQGIAAQRAFHAAPDANLIPPMTYVYPPLTFPLLRVVALFRRSVAESLFFASLIAGFALQLWTGWQMADSEERRWLRWLLPAVAFFPGLINDDVLLSGNIAYLLYGLVLASAVRGWKRNRWSLYYAAVLFASCFKAPLLSLLALPIVADKRQWRAASLSATAGVLLIAMQASLWPKFFHGYLTAVQLQFDFNHDFGMAPSGILGNALLAAGRPYSFATGALYLVFAATVYVVLLWTSRSIRMDAALRDRWMPVALIGTVLLNPRIKEYDVAALTIPMVLIASRFLQLLVRPQQGRISEMSGASQVSSGDPQQSRGGVSPNESLVCLLLAGGWFLAINTGAGGDTWKPIELSLLLVTFVGGTWWTWHQVHQPTPTGNVLRISSRKWRRRRRLAIPGQQVLP